MITIIVLWILLIIIALIVILLHFSIKAKVSIKSGEEPEICVKYLMFQIYPKKPREEKPVKRKKPVKAKEFPPHESFDNELDKDIAELENAQSPDEVAESVQDEQAKNDEKSAEESTVKGKAKKEKKSKKPKGEGKIAELKRRWQTIKPFAPVTWKYFKKLLKAIRIKKAEVHLTSGKADAYECAMSYGKLNAALFNGLAVVGGIFTLKLKSAGVECKFNEYVFKYDVSATVYVRPSTIIAIAVCVGVNYLKIILRARRKAKKERKRLEKLKNNQKINEMELLANECE